MVVMINLFFAPNSHSPPNITAFVPLETSKCLLNQCTIKKAFILKNKPTQREHLRTLQFVVPNISTAIYTGLYQAFKTNICLHQLFSHSQKCTESKALAKSKKIICNIIQY